MVKTGAMTFTEAALEILKREGKPLHFKELTERAMTKKLLTFVGRTPEVTMQTQLTAAVKKAPGNPFVRVKPGVFGLLRYPEMPAEDRGRQPAPEAAEAPKREAHGPKSDKADEKKERRPPEKRVADEAAPTGERERRRRRRGGRGRGGVGAKDGESAAPRAEEGESESPARRSAREAAEKPPEETDDEPSTGGLSPEARAAALAETGVLEGGDQELAAGEDDDEGDEDDDEEGDTATHRGERPVPPAVHGHAPRVAADEVATRANDQDTARPDESGEDEGDAFGPLPASEGAQSADDDDPARRRRRRRRRRRGGVGGEGEFAEGAPSAASPSPDSPRAADGNVDAPEGPSEGVVPASTPGRDSAAAVGGESPPSNDAGNAPGQAARKIMAPVDAAVEILRGQPPGRGVHVRQIADSAIRRRLIHGEPNEAWRVIRTSLAAEPKERLRNGMRPRVRAAGSGLYALARRTPDAELEKAEQVFGEARRALRERTIAALEKRITELPSGAFEALARVLLQREGFGPTTFVKRVEGTIYVEALRGRGSRPSKCLIALRPGTSPAGRRAIGELRAGVRARGQDEGLLMLGGRLAEDAISEWKQPGCPLEIADGAALAETCARHGVGVLSATVNVDFVDADFFADMAEG
jgi:hypothetical protein